MQFLRWTTHQSLREHNRRSAMPGPEDDGSVACLLPTNTTEPLPFDEPGVVVAATPNLATLVAGIAQQHARQWEAPTFDAARITDWCNARGLPNVNEWMKLGAWLWSTGVKNADAIVALMDECERLKPANPYAYFAAGNVAREAIVGRFHVDQRVKEHEQQKRETAAFLGKPT